MKTILEPWSGGGYELHTNVDVTDAMISIAKAVPGVDHCTGGGLSGRYRMLIGIGKCFDKLEVISEVRRRIELLHSATDSDQSS